MSKQRIYNEYPDSGYSRASSARITQSPVKRYTRARFRRVILP